jgi:hypothetical protein
LGEIADQRDADVEELHSRLAEALKTCRSIVSNYREMIAAEQHEEQPQPERWKEDGGPVGPLNAS